MNGYALAIKYNPFFGYDICPLRACFLGNVIVCVWLGVANGHEPNFTEDSADTSVDPELETDDTDDDYPSEDEADFSEDPKVLFARLKEAARKNEEEWGD